MDGLLTCAKAFEDLLPVKYHIIIGRKGKSVDLTVSFEAVEFHHFVGLHKLHDLRLSRASREKVFSQILSGQITLDDIKKNRYFCSIQNRLESFRKIEALSLIEAEYLLSTPHEYTDVYIFLDKKDEAWNFFCRSFFPKEDRDYTKGQAVCTLLKKEKINTDTGTVQVQYDRLSPKDKD